MQEKLVDAPSRMLPDSEFFKVVADMAQRWFRQDITVIPLEKKLRLMPYIWRTRKTTVPQLSRALGVGQETVLAALKRPLLGEVSF
jgi:hypothetical protein